MTTVAVRKKPKLSVIQLLWTISIGILIGTLLFIFIAMEFFQPLFYPPQFTFLIAVQFLVSFVLAGSAMLVQTLRNRKKNDPAVLFWIKLGAVVGWIAEGIVTFVMRMC